jgi:hypothetical protein
MHEREGERDRERERELLKGKELHCSEEERYRPHGYLQTNLLS